MFRLGRRGASGGVRRPRCSVSVLCLWKDASPSGFHRDALSEALLQLCAPGPQHLDDNSKVVTQLFSKTHRTFLGLVGQTQVPHLLPNVGTSRPQVKSGHPLPCGRMVLWAHQSVHHPLTPPPCLGSCLEKKAWSVSVAQETCDHPPQSPRASCRRHKLGAAPSTF